MEIAISILIAILIIVILNLTKKANKIILLLTELSKTEESQIIEKKVTKIPVIQNSYFKDSELKK